MFMELNHLSSKYLLNVYFIDIKADTDIKTYSSEIWKYSNKQDKVLALMMK